MYSSRIEQNNRKIRKRTKQLVLFTESEFMMKLMIMLYLHYTEVALPRLAEEQGWSLIWSHQFQTIIYNLLGVSNRKLTRRELCWAVSFCKMIVNEPSKIDQFKDLSIKA